MRYLAVVSLLIAGIPVGAAEPGADWAFQPRQRPMVPSVRTASSVQTPIDAFLLARLEVVGLRFSPAADRRTLIRRLSFDLVGLPPTADQIDQFVNDRARDAYERLVERLLASPQYGERQATWWLDLVRYAESDGFKADDPRPEAWRYRDYVIQAFNSDLPYDRFIREQLAGDELDPTNPRALIATGFLRHYPDEYNAVNCEQRRQEILNDLTDTTSAVFLGLTLGCARCHDHKFDPILQTDYYRIQAFFAAYWPVTSPLVDPDRRVQHQRKMEAWEKETAEVRQRLAELEKLAREAAQKKERMRFAQEYASILDIPMEQRTPWQRQIGAMVERQVYSRSRDFGKSMKGPAKDEWQTMMKKMAEYEKQRPAALPQAMGCTDVGPVAPPTRLLKRGDWRKPAEIVEPGFLSAIDDREAEIKKPAGPTTGRRLALAHWIAQDDHPLTARVIVNRIWQTHFGTGLVGTSSDLGAQGDRPVHRELLDWLANEFVANGWRIKHLHRLIVASAAYRQASKPSPEAVKADPENKLFSRMARRRLEGEALRDSLLTVAGRINHSAGGPSVYPELPGDLKGVKTWPVSAHEAERNRRSVYVAVRRNLRYPLFAVFDSPDAIETCSRRHVTTTAPQALMLLNDSVVADLAGAFALRVLAASTTPDGVIREAVSRALQRSPTEAERDRLRRFLDSQVAVHRSRVPGISSPGSTETAFAAAVVDLCHALINLNEFLFVD